MNLVAAVRFYIRKMTDESGSGMKILLMDQDTVIRNIESHKIMILLFILLGLRNVSPKIGFTFRSI